MRSLEQRKAKLVAEQQNYVAALGGSEKQPKVLVDKLNRLEVEIEELDRSITEARDRVQPLVMARTITDYQLGDESLFSGDLVRDRGFVRELVKEILVYPDGSVIVKFRQASLLAPVTNCQLDLSTPNAAAGLSADRERHQLVYECTLGVLRMLDVLPTPPAQVSAHTGSDGEPVYSVQPTGDWSAVVGTAPAPTEGSDEAARYRKRPQRDSNPCYLRERRVS